MTNPEESDEISLEFGHTVLPGEPYPDVMWQLPDEDNMSVADRLKIPFLIEQALQDLSLADEDSHISSL